MIKLFQPQAQPPKTTLSYTFLVCSVYCYTQVKTKPKQRCSVIEYI